MLGTLHLIEARDSWFESDPAQAIVSIQGVNQQISSDSSWLQIGVNQWMEDSESAVTFK